MLSDIFVLCKRLRHTSVHKVHQINPAKHGNDADIQLPYQLCFSFCVDRSQRARSFHIFHLHRSRGRRLQFLLVGRIPPRTFEFGSHYEGKFLEVDKRLKSVTREGLSGNGDRGCGVFRCQTLHLIFRDQKGGHRRHPMGYAKRHDPEFLEASPLASADWCARVYVLGSYYWRARSVDPSPLKSKPGTEVIHILVGLWSGRAALRRGAVGGLFSAYRVGGIITTLKLDR